MSESGSGFRFDLGQVVKLVESDETGVVTGRAEYKTSQNQYWLRYKNAQGCQVEQWWGEDSLQAV